MASFVVVLEGDLRAGNFDAGFLLGDLRDGDLREGDCAGGEVFLLLAGDLGGDTPLRVLGGLNSTALGRIRPLLVDILLETNNSFLYKRLKLSQRYRQAATSKITHLSGSLMVFY